MERPVPQQPVCGATLLGLPLAAAHRIADIAARAASRKLAGARVRVWVRDTTAALQCLLPRGGPHSPNGGGGQSALSLQPAGTSTSPYKSPGILYRRLVSTS